jgi:hypothetical protein
LDYHVWFLFSPLFPPSVTRLEVHDTLLFCLIKYILEFGGMTLETYQKFVNLSSPSSASGWLYHSTSVSFPGKCLGESVAFSCDVFEDGKVQELKTRRKYNLKDAKQKNTGELSTNMD